MAESMQSGLYGITAVNQRLAERMQILNRLATVAAQSGGLTAQGSMRAILSTLAAARGLADKLDLLRGFLIPDLRDLDPALYDYVSQLPGPAQSLFQDLSLFFDFAYDIADKVPIRPILIAPDGPLAGDPLYAFAGFFSQRLRGLDYARGRYDAFKAWETISQLPEREFTIEGVDAPDKVILPQPGEDSLTSSSEYAQSAQRFKARIDTVIASAIRELKERAKGQPLAVLALDVLQIMADVGVGNLISGSSG
jgi:hypothetical protein